MFFRPWGAAVPISALPQADAPDPRTVAPIVDYEPPAHVVPRHRHPPARPRRRCPSPAVPAEQPGTRQPVALSPTLRAAAEFTDAALRRVLEVIDRRRPAAQLYPLLAAGLVDSVRAVRPARTGRTDTATLQRLRVQAVGLTDPLSAVEVFGTYRRGRRVHAVACRVHRAATPTKPGIRGGWQVVALHIG